MIETSTAPVGAAPAPADWYRERRDRFRAEAGELATTAARLANVRLLLFLGAAASAIWAYWASGPLQLVLWVVAAGLAVAFVVQVRRYHRVERRRRHLSGLADLAEEALQRVDRDWGTLALRHDDRPRVGHPYATDLDILGYGSLLHLLESTGTHLGTDTLCRWLLAPSAPETVQERQEAVAELSALAEWREELVCRGRATGTPSPDPAPFLAWAEGEPALAGRTAALWLARVSPVLFWGLGLAHWGGYLVWPWWFLPLIVNGLVRWRFGSIAVERLESVRYLAGGFDAYGNALDHVTAHSFQSGELRRILGALTIEHGAAGDAIRRLGGIIRWAQPASSMIYPLIELTTLWNVHILSMLEGWQVAHGTRARGWLAALGEVEALAALARLQHDNPSWCMPTLDPTATAFEAQALGHPLLEADGRVPNDVTLGPAGTFLLVTGSNMSGKSTLLRAVGVNTVLAQAGGPVCATALTMPPLGIWTSMRVSDSLERGVSFFMAELQRLKQVVDSAQDAGMLASGAAPDSPRVLYLLDEILQGTNTAERQIAARRVIRLLLHTRAIGAVSTHDLTLADAPDLAAAARAVHLTETVVDGPNGAQMTFDYQVRAGVARSTNALRLLDFVGLTEPAVDGGATLPEG